MIGGFELPTGRPDRAARAGRHRRPARQAPGQHGLPELRAVPAPRRRRQRRVRAAPQAAWPRPRSATRVGEALELVHLPGYERRKPNQLSGGQQQRVALARALVNRPNVLLLDEPLGALDLKLRRQLQVELKRIQVEVGITFVYVTHDQEEALTMSDRIAVMNARPGRAARARRRSSTSGPRRRFVADFIGTTNLLSGTVDRPDGGVTRVRLARGELTRGRRRTGSPPGSPSSCSVRPEAITLRSRPTPSAPIRGQVEQVAYLGTNVQYLVRTAGGLSLTVLAPRPAGRLPGRQRRRTSAGRRPRRSSSAGDASGSQEEAPG